MTLVKHKRAADLRQGNETKTPVGRYIGSAGAAGALTFTLGVTMALMIKTNFTPAEKIEAHAFEINPVAEDIEPPRREVKLDILHKVEVPPPTPRIEVVEKTQPSVSIVELKGTDDLDWTLPVISRGDFIINAADSEETPLYRAEPIMPPRAERSGHCVMRFNVSAEGAPYDIQAQSCSQNMFARPSVKAVSQWKYRAKTVHGQRVARTGLSTRLTFQLSDARGQLIPE